MRGSTPTRVGAGRVELPISCPQSRRASHYATPRGAVGSLVDPARTLGRPSEPLWDHGHRRPLGASRV